MSKRRMHPSYAIPREYTSREMSANTNQGRERAPGAPAAEERRKDGKIVATALSGNYSRGGKPDRGAAPTDTLGRRNRVWNRTWHSHSNPKSQIHREQPGGSPYNPWLFREIGQTNVTETASLGNDWLSRPHFGSFLHCVNYSVCLLYPRVIYEVLVCALPSRNNNMVHNKCIHLELVFVHLCCSRKYLIFFSLAWGTCLWCSLNVRGTWLSYLLL